MVQRTAVIIHSTALCLLGSCQLHIFWKHNQHQLVLKCSLIEFYFSILEFPFFQRLLMAEDEAQIRSTVAMENGETSKRLDTPHGNSDGKY